MQLEEQTLKAKLQQVTFWRKGVQVSLLQSSFFSFLFSSFCLICSVVSSILFSFIRCYILFKSINKFLSVPCSVRSALCSLLFSILFYSILFYFVLYYSILFYFVMFCSVLFSGLFLFVLFFFFYIVVLACFAWCPYAINKCNNKVRVSLSSYWLTLVTWPTRMGVG